MNYPRVTFSPRSYFTGSIKRSNPPNNSISAQWAVSGVLSLLITLCAPPGVQAADTWREGWFGELLIGGGVVSARPSGIEVADDNERRGSLFKEGSRESEGLLLVDGEIGYGFQKTGTMVSAGGGTEKPWHLTFGQEIGTAGRIGLSVFYQAEEAWENPYLVNANRERTDATAFGYGIIWHNIMHSGLDVVAEQMYIDVDQDRIGEVEPELQRDGRDTTVGISYPWSLGRGGLLRAGISYIDKDRDGQAESGNGFTATIKHVLDSGRFTFATEFELSAAAFDAPHPVFGRKREEATFTLSETISLAEPFGLKNAYLFGVAACFATESDITFFDGSGVLVGSGFGYRF